MLNTKGEVIGVASSQVRGGQSLNLAVPVECATRLLAKVQPSAKPKPLSQTTNKLAPQKDNPSGIGAGSVMKGLRKIGVTVTAPTGGDLLRYQIRTDVEIKLRKAGLAIDENAPALFRVGIIMTDIDPTGQRILGKYGKVDATFCDIVTLRRISTHDFSAPVWQSMEHLFHGPPDTIAAQARQIAADVTDEFVNELLKQNQ